MVLSVDSSIHGIGFVLSQYDTEGHKVPARYGSLPLTKVQSHYPQSKLELYGLMKALWHYRIFIDGAENLIAEVDVASIKGMLNKPDVQASAHINHWIEAVLIFDFDLKHVLGISHKVPDTLSRRGFTEQEKKEGLEPKIWIDDLVLLGMIEPRVGKGEEEGEYLVDLEEMEDETEENSIVLAAIRNESEEKLDQIMQFLVTLRLP